MTNYDNTSLTSCTNPSNLDTDKKDLETGKKTLAPLVLRYHQSSDYQSLVLSDFKKKLTKLFDSKPKTQDEEAKKDDLKKTYPLIEKTIKESLYRLEVKYFEPRIIKEDFDVLKNILKKYISKTNKLRPYSGFSFTRANIKYNDYLYTTAWYPLKGSLTYNQFNDMMSISNKVHRHIPLNASEKITWFQNCNVSLAAFDLVVNPDHYSSYPDRIKRDINIIQLILSLDSSDKMIKIMRDNVGQNLINIAQHQGEKTTQVLNNIVFDLSENIIKVTIEVNQHVLNLNETELRTSIQQIQNLKPDINHINNNAIEQIRCEIGHLNFLDFHLDSIFPTNNLQEPPNQIIETKYIRIHY